MLGGKHGRDMSSELEVWARIERKFIEDEIRWLNAGAKWKSPSGDDISAEKLQELKLRLEHVQKALDGKTNAPGS
jgi:hypothetical protein